MLKSAATTQSTPARGTTATVDSSQIAKYSLGGGLSEGAAKKITVIIFEGKELEIREIGGEPF